MLPAWSSRYWITSARRHASARQNRSFSGFRTFRRYSGDTTTGYVPYSACARVSAGDGAAGHCRSRLSARRPTWSLAHLSRLAPPRPHRGPVRRRVQGLTTAPRRLIPPTTPSTPRQHRRQFGSTCGGYEVDFERPLADTPPRIREPRAARGDGSNTRPRPTGARRRLAALATPDQSGPPIPRRDPGGLFIWTARAPRADRIDPGRRSIGRNRPPTLI